MNHGSAGDGSRMEGGRSVFARATERKRRYWDQPFGIQNKKKIHNLDVDMHGERPDGR